MIFILIILCVGGLFIFKGILFACRSKGHSGVKRWLVATGGILLALGALGFFGTGFSALGGLRWLPASFEWPAGFVQGILIMPDGSHAVPHTPSGRVQIYDSNWKYVRGWWLNAGGGTFLLRRKETNTFEAITARLQMRYQYAMDGSLISHGSYSPQNYSDFTRPDYGAVIPTRWWLWMFTSPWYSWMVLMLGMILLGASDRLKKPKKNLKRVPAQSPGS